MEKLAELQGKFREFHEFYGSDALEVEFWIEGFGLNDLRYVFTPHGAKPVQSLGPMTVGQPAGSETRFETIIVVANPGYAAAIGELLNLCRTAGNLLLSSELELAGVSEFDKPELRWLAVVLNRLRGTQPAFVESTHYADGPQNRTAYETLARPFLASAKVIEAITLGGQNAGAAAPRPTHSEDFASVDWFGTRYTFSKGLQSNAIRALWAAWENGRHGLAMETIAVKIGTSDSKFRLAQAFRDKKRSGMHPAWGTMIRADGKGVYRLIEPKSTI